MWSLLLAALVTGTAVALARYGLGVTAFEPFGAYLAAVCIGAVLGLVTGKPVWAKGARIEAGLKAFFGALVAAGLMFALRSWVSVDLDLTFLGLDSSVTQKHPALAFPSVGLLLTLLFSIDNMFGGSDSDTPQAKKRIATSNEGRRAGQNEAIAESEDVAVSPMKRKR